MIKNWVGRALALGLALCVWCAGQAPAQEDFPFGHELLLDARPLKGSKRVPSIEVEANGAATIELWCDSVQGQIVISADAITISTGEKTDQQCAQERGQADEALIDTLKQVTSWRWDGETLILKGAKELRFRLQTN